MAGKVMDLVTQGIIAGAAVILVSLVGWLVVEANKGGKELVAIRKDIEHILEKVLKVDDLEATQKEHIHKIEDLNTYCSTSTKRFKALERFLTKKHGVEFSEFYEEIQASLSR